MKIAAILIALVIARIVKDLFKSKISSLDREQMEANIQYINNVRTHNEPS